MESVIVPFILGVIISILGVSNMKGNISSIHWYHRQRVTEENKIPFGKEVGLGTVIIGITVIVHSVLTLVTELTEHNLFVNISEVITVLGIVVGLALSFHAMIKYNKGIF